MYFLDFVDMVNVQAHLLLELRSRGKSQVERVVCARHGACIFNAFTYTPIIQSVQVPYGRGRKGVSGDRKLNPQATSITRKTIQACFYERITRLNQLREGVDQLFQISQHARQIARYGCLDSPPFAWLHLVPHACGRRSPPVR